MTPSSAPRYTRCPKCGHRPLPPNQALPTACPACGVILAKFGQRVSRAPRSVQDTPRGAPGALAQWLLYVPERIEAWRWWLHAAVLTAAAVYFLVVVPMNRIKAKQAEEASEPTNEEKMIELLSRIANK